MAAHVNGKGGPRGTRNGPPRLVNGIPRLPPINTPASVISSNNRDYSKSKLMTHRRAKEMQGLLTDILYKNAKEVELDIGDSNRKRPPTAQNPHYPKSVSILRQWCESGICFIRFVFVFIFTSCFRKTSFSPPRFNFVLGK